MFLKTETETIIIIEVIIRFVEFSNCKIPQIIGVINGVQIEVISPSNDIEVDCFRKQDYLINTQATIEASLVFSTSRRLPR